MNIRMVMSSRLSLGLKKRHLIITRQVNNDKQNRQFEACARRDPSAVDSNSVPNAASNMSPHPGIFRVRACHRTRALAACYCK
jgi:hypothetical protein